MVWTCFWTKMKLSMESSFFKEFDNLTGSQTLRQWQLFESCELLGLHMSPLVRSMGLIVSLKEKKTENIDK